MIKQNVHHVQQNIIYLMINVSHVMLIVKNVIHLDIVLNVIQDILIKMVHAQLIIYQIV